MLFLSSCFQALDQTYTRRQPRALILEPPLTSSFPTTLHRPCLPLSFQTLTRLEPTQPLSLPPLALVLSSAPALQSCLSLIYLHWQ